MNAEKTEKEQEEEEDSEEDADDWEEVEGESGINKKTVSNYFYILHFTYTGENIIFTRGVAC